MGTLLSRKTIIKVKLETDLGVEATGDLALYAEDLEINESDEFIQRPGTGLYVGNSNPGVVEGRAGKCTFKTELKGNGTGGMDSAVAACLQACWLVKTSEVYSVASSPTSWKTLSIDVYEDGLEKTIYGAMGNCTLETTAGKRVMLNFDFDGIWKGPADIALPAFAPSARAPMMFAGGTVSIGGAARKIDKLNISLQNTVTARLDGAGAGGVAHYCVTHNDPQIECDPEAELLAVWDVHGIRRAGTPQIVSIVITDGTDKVTIAAPAMQIKTVSEGDREMLRTYDIVGQCNHSLGNDALSFTAALAAA